jgi:hypothetical protein
VNVPDVDLVKLLEARDGPLVERSFAHDEANCRYSEQYEGQACPWCEAVRRRHERQAAAAKPGAATLD